MNLASVRKDYSLHWHFRNCNHTSEIPKISTRHPQTPNEAIGTLSAMFNIREVIKKVRMESVPPALVVSSHAPIIMELNTCVTETQQIVTENIIDTFVANNIRTLNATFSYTTG